MRGSRAFEVLAALVLYLFAGSYELRADLLFYESFNDAASIAANGGTPQGAINFVPGVAGNAADLGYSYVQYPRTSSFSEGSVEFWFKPGVDFFSRARGFFDIGLMRGDHPHSMGVFVSNGATEVFIELIGAVAGGQARRSISLDPGNPTWHHIAAVWRCNSSGDFTRIYVDGVPSGTFTFGGHPCGFAPTAAEFWVGNNYYYGVSASIMDEFKIYDHARTQDEIKTEVMPRIDSFSPAQTAIVSSSGAQLSFSVAASNPLSSTLTYEWAADGAVLGSNSSFSQSFTGPGVHTVTVTVSNGVASTQQGWEVLIPGLPTDVAVFDGSIFIGSRRFLVKGVDYAPWFEGYGPDPYRDLPFPAAASVDVTNLVTYGGKRFVPDYSGDGRIQAWEVVRLDLENIRAIGANTIRTYATGAWHDKNRNSIVDRSAVPEVDEIAQGDLPEWAVDQIVAFCEANDLKLILGYWVQEEDFQDEDSGTAGRQLICDANDLLVAQETLARVVDRYGASTAVIAWGIGNEVHLDGNHTWFSWGLDIKEYLNALYGYVRSIDPGGKPILYAKYIGEAVDFTSLSADIIGPQAYIFSAQELVDAGEFDDPAPAGRAYMLPEFGHIISQAAGHWALAEQYAGGCFLEYNDVPWKGSSGAQNEMGMVEEYRAIKRSRANVVYNLYTGGTDFDADQDGFGVGIDCNDANAAVNPGVVEICDGTDNNCDGAIDEGCGPQSVTLEATAGNDTIVITLGATTHTVRINTITKTYPASEINKIIINALGGSDYLYIYGYAQGETAKATGQSVSFKGTGYEVAASGAEMMILRAGSVAGSSAELSGGVNSMRLYSYPAYTYMTDSPRTAYYYAYGFGAVTATAGGEANRNYAFLYGSTGDDEVIANPTGVAMERGTGEDITANGFSRVYVYDQGGTDTAELTGAESTEDRLYSYAAYTTMMAIRSEYYFYLRGFEDITATSQGSGINYAYMYDSPGDDRLIATPSSIVMERANPASVVRAVGYKRLYGYATYGGKDTAELSGGNTGNRLTAHPEYVNYYDSAGSFYYYLRGYDKVKATASTGAVKDYAYLYDSKGDDLFYGTGSMGYMEDKAKALYHNEVKDFDYVYAYSTDTNTDDDVVIDGSVSYTFRKTGTW